MPQFMQAGIALVLLVALLLALTGCSISTVTTLLVVITDAAEIALPVIAAAAGVPPPVIALVMTYVHQVSTAISETSAELQTADPPAVRAEKITAIWAGVALTPGVLAGLPANVSAAITAIAHAVENFLAHLTTAKKAIAAGPVAKTTPVLEMNRKDRGALDKISKRAAAVAVQIDQFKAGHK